MNDGEAFCCGCFFGLLIEVAIVAAALVITH